MLHTDASYIIYFISKYLFIGVVYIVFVYSTFFGFQLGFKFNFNLHQLIFEGVL